MKVAFNNETNNKITFTSYSRRLIISENFDFQGTIESIDLNSNDATLQTTIINQVRPYLNTNITNLKVYNDEDNLILDLNFTTAKIDDLSQIYDEGQVALGYQLRVLLDVYE